jgi:YD repeat-containing protein
MFGIFSTAVPGIPARRGAALLLSMVTLAGLLGGGMAGGSAAAPPLPGGTPRAPGTLVGQSVAARPLPPSEGRPAKGRQVVLPPVSWPAAGSAVVDLPDSGAPRAVVDVGRQAGTLPVWVQPAASSTGRKSSAAGAGRRGSAPTPAAAPSRVKVEMFDRDLASRLGVSGVVLQVSRADGSAAAGTARVSVDYAGFRGAFGGGYEHRLRLLQFPACAVTTPDAPGCANGTSVKAEVDTATHRLAAEVRLTGTNAAGGSVFAVAAGVSGGTGNYAATPLKASAEWSSGGSAGQFTWSYPMRTPPSPAGAAPQLELGYASGAVDGATAAENNQSGPAGMGFDLGSSYIERRYAACAYNGHAGGDLCWKYDNAYLVLNGVATELIRQTDTLWHAKKDPGWRIERLRGGGLPGRDNDDERWMVTTQDGTRYHLGLSRQPGTLAATNSVWTVPVFGLKAGDPCWTGTYKTSSCEQAWRWNLDYVQDPKGNTTTYKYEAEGNFYGRNNDVYDQAYYIRGGNLTQIQYGTREYHENDGAAAWVNLYLKGRCAGGKDDCGPANKQNAKNYPDTPVDLLCTNSEKCLNHSPAFFSLKRLNAVTTYVHNPAAPAPNHAQMVDSYDFNFAFYGPNNNTVDPLLYLFGIVHTGGAGSAQPITLKPGTWFQYVANQHRVDVDTAHGSPTLMRHHLAHVYDEYGSAINVTYGQPHPCNVARLPAEAANTTNCFPAWYQPEGRPAKFGWFQKYLVTKVVEHDRTGLSPDQTTTYGYGGTPAWHFDTGGYITPLAQQSWGQWRGYTTVYTTQGVTAGAQTHSSEMIFRGMHGDRSNRTGSTKPASLTNSNNVVQADHDFLEGQVWEQRSWNGVSWDELSSTINSFWTDKTWDGGTSDSYIVRVGQTDTRIEAKDLPGQMRHTRTKASFEDNTGLPTTAADLGQVTAAGADVPGDETCTITEYARNNPAWRFYPSRVHTHQGAGCAAADPLLDLTEAFYDGHPGLFDAPTNGLPTAVRTYTTKDTYTETKTRYDMYGRIVSSTDPAGRTSTTAYEPAGLKPTTKLTTTNPLGWSTTTTLAFWWGTPASVVDVNGKRTDIDYDALGRPVRVWKADQAKATNGGTPSLEFAYGVSPYTPNWTRTRTLQSIKADGAAVYTDAWAYLDGFGEEAETQTPSPVGGRTVTAKRYDNRGLLNWASAPMHNAAAAGSAVLNPAPNTVPSRTVHTYDTLGRETTAQLWALTAKKWQTTSANGGDRTTVTPPSGGATTTIVDAHDQVIRTQEYKGPATAGTPHVDTTRMYSPDGQLASMTDPAGNTARYNYDLLGRVIETVDPDEVPPRPRRHQL